VQGGIEGAFLHLEQVIGGTLNVLHDAVTVQAAALGEGFENQKIETSLQIIFRQDVHLGFSV
jgi:hypothetical protein